MALVAASLAKTLFSEPDPATQSENIDAAVPIFFNQSPPPEGGFGSALTHT